MSRSGIAFAKGHGTGNDFVILTDLEGRLGLTGEEVQRLCDRRHGIGADGVLVVTRASASAEAADQPEADYFMDYRNADGSLAQMCGNGARVFVRFLLQEGFAEPGEWILATRGGGRRVNADLRGSIRVDMGPAVLLDEPDLTVSTHPDGAVRPALGVLMPNPHAVCWVDDLADAGSLLAPPSTTPDGVFPEGVNVEFVEELGDQHLAMRVHERGVGETQSCGTGACAAAVGTLARRGSGPLGQRMRVDVPGGTVHVKWRSDGEVQLIGPAIMVARGVIEDEWWERP
jgi:diaminopimelate epimerase